MRAEYVNPFVNGAFGVLQEVLSAEITRGELFLKSSSQQILPVTTMVGLTGNLEGRILFEMDEQTAIAIAAEMNGEAFDSFDELAKATITELSNMIAARAVTELDRLGFTFDISPPTMLTGQDMEVVTGTYEALIVPVETAWGRLQINVVLEERRGDA